MSLRLREGLASGLMEFIVHDTLSVMGRLLRGPLEKRPDALREMLAPLWSDIPAQMAGDVIATHHDGGGFRVDADDPRYEEALAELESADVLGRIEHELTRAADRLAHLGGPGGTQVMFVLGNPDDAYLMNVSGGYLGMGGTPGWLYVMAWPTPENLGRIAHCAVHELHHRLRHHVVGWDPPTVTVGDHVVSEGLAEAFVRELSGPEAMGPWSAMVTGEALENAYTAIMADIDLQGMWNTPAYVLGDAAAERFGAAEGHPGHGRVRRRPAARRRPPGRHRHDGHGELGSARRRHPQGEPLTGTNPDS
ncbi:hypothetical protein GCM10009560_16510 [Nonomuraea longicatena]|uniref:DUF2268 domain-containing protein n=1 Tax=Nonomuraea longicatena TaxID=83682 RepID=A0ABN1NY40_9ACTN